MTKPAPKTKHHHGNLRQALIEAGLSLLEEGGIEALSLRKCAARAGVSHAAPAHHFDGLPGLTKAIGEEGFRVFTAYLQGYIAEHTDPREKLRALCRGYLQFGLDHAGLLKVIFGAGLAAYVDDKRGDADAYQVLRACCAPFIPAGENSQIVEIQVWSLIHGFTLLYISGEFGAPPPAIPDGPFDQVMGLLDRVGTAPAP